MGYLEDEVKRLQTVLGNVEGRLKKLEERQFGGTSGKTAEEIRMILIGPPGAGKLVTATRLRLRPRINRLAGKGTQAPKIKEKFSCCHLVSQLDLETRYTRTAR
jgi:adenylate kinase